MKNEIKELIMGLGADVCGIANIDRFSEAPEGFNPRDIFPDCKSVIVFGIALPKGLTKIDPKLIYAHFNRGTYPYIDGIAFKASKELKRFMVGMLYRFPLTVPVNIGMRKTLKAVV